MVDGWLVEVSPISSLTEEQRDAIRWELSILAVSTQGLFDDPVLIEGTTMRAYYLQDYHASETVQHIKAHLQAFGLNDQISVTLQATQWVRR